MHLLHLNSYFITNKLHAELVKVLAVNSEWHQTVFIPVQHTAEIGKNQFSAERVSLVYAKVFSALERRLWPLKQWRIWQAVQQMVPLREVSVIHAHTLVVNGMIALWLRRKYGIPYVVSVRNTDVNKFIARIPFMKRVVAPIFREAQHIYFLSPVFWDKHLTKHYSEAFLASIAHKVHFLPNGIQAKWLEDQPLAVKAIDDVIDILFVGALLPNKNLKGVLACCNQLQAAQKTVRLSIVGEGPEKVLIPLNAPFEVIYHGFVNDFNALRDIYRSADVLLVPSFTETFGLVYAEAISQGLPVLYTQGQGFDGQFEEGEVGYAINPNDPISMAEKVLLVAANYQRISSYCLRGAQKFNWNTISKSYLSSYHNCSKA